MDANDAQPVSVLPGERSAQSPSENPLQARIPSLDVLRGVAVLGALFVSIWLFGGFSTNQQTQLLTHPSGSNYRLFAAVSLLLEGKMRALIALVAGASLLLAYARFSNSKNVPSAADGIIRRQMWLIAFGLVNALLFLWPHDLLFHLGVMGILLFPFMDLGPRGLLTAAAVCLLVFCGKQYWNYADDQKAYNKYLAVTVVEKKIRKDSADRHRSDSLAKATAAAGATGKAATKDTASKKVSKDTLTKKQAADKAAWEGMVKGMKYDQKKDEGNKKAMRETSYFKLYNHLLQRTQSREAEWTYRIGIWELGMMMLLGMALLKLGFFEQRYGTGRYLAMGLSLVAAGLLLGWFRLYFQNATLLNYEKYITRHVIPFNQFVPMERALMATGYAALLMGIIRAGWWSGLLGTLAKAGRMSLTLYLLQSIFCSWFFTGFGSGNFGKLSQWQLYFTAAEVVMVQLVLVTLWFRHYPQGPAEWLWRCAVQRRWLPFRRIRQSPTTEAPAIIS